ncbi:hypothetical protein NY63_19110 [Xanthomonas citri pv. fuscans]|nr:hypothetical protein NY63_19110 [Xanthomonas citri pv. fuscans]
MLRRIDLIDLLPADTHLDVAKLHHSRYQLIAFVLNLPHHCTEIFGEDRRILWQVTRIEINPYYTRDGVWGGLHQHLLGLGRQALLLVHKSLQGRVLDFV